MPIIALLPADTDPLVVADGEPAEALHVTVVYLGDETATIDLAAVQGVLGGVPLPLQATVSGVGVLGADQAIVLMLDSAGIVAVREQLVQALAAVGIEPADPFPSFVPHLTVAFPTDDVVSFVGDAVTQVGAVIDFDRLAIVEGNTILWARTAAAPAPCSCHTRAAALDYGMIAGRIPLEHIDPRYFELPATMTAQTKMSVELDGDLPGHVFGVVAPRDRCILDGSKSCWTVDDLQADDPDLEWVHQGDAVLADGQIFKIAPLSGGIGHAPDGLTAAQARDWMGSQGTQIARVRYAYHPEFGLVAAGVLWPEIASSARAVAGLRASPTSLDARWMSLVSYAKESGRFLFSGAVFVNIPGMPVARAAAMVPDFDDAFALLFEGGNLHVLGGDPETLIRSAAMSAENTPAAADPVEERFAKIEAHQAALDAKFETLAKAELDRQDVAVAALAGD